MDAPLPDDVASNEAPFIVWKCNFEYNFEFEYDIITTETC